MENRKILIAGIILLAVLSRLLPHPPNIAPITAIALFGTASLSGFIGIVIPLFIMFLSDLFLGFHKTIPFVYGSFFLISVLGLMLRNHASFKRVTFITTISSLLFFFITNFGVWLTSSMYPHTVQGLTQAYLMGIPFLRNTLAGDFFYTYSLFYGYLFVNNYLHVWYRSLTSHSGVGKT